MAQDDEASCTEQERLLVEEITAPGGVRAAPPRERLNAFINRSANVCARQFMQGESPVIRKLNVNLQCMQTYIS